MTEPTNARYRAVELILDAWTKRFPALLPAPFFAEDAQKAVDALMADPILLRTLAGAEPANDAEAEIRAARAAADRYGAILAELDDVLDKHEVRLLDPAGTMTPAQLVDLALTEASDDEEDEDEEDVIEEVPPLRVQETWHDADGTKHTQEWAALGSGYLTETRG